VSGQGDRCSQGIHGALARSAAFPSRIAWHRIDGLHLRAKLRVGFVAVHLQEGIGVGRLAHQLGKIQRGHLQQAYRTL